MYNCVATDARCFFEIYHVVSMAVIYFGQDLRTSHKSYEYRWMCFICERAIGVETSVIYIIETSLFRAPVCGVLAGVRLYSNTTVFSGGMHALLWNAFLALHPQPHYTSQISLFFNR